MILTSGIPEGREALDAERYSNPQASSANRYGVKASVSAPGLTGEFKNRSSRYQTQPARHSKFPQTAQGADCERWPMNQRWMAGSNPKPAPKGLGWPGYEPLMKNPGRADNECPRSPIGIQPSTILRQHSVNACQGLAPGGEGGDPSAGFNTHKKPGLLSNGEVRQGLRGLSVRGVDRSRTNDPFGGAQEASPAIRGISVESKHRNACTEAPYKTACVPAEDSRQVSSPNDFAAPTAAVAESARIGHGDF